MKRIATLLGCLFLLGPACKPDPSAKKSAAEPATAAKPPDKVERSVIELPDKGKEDEGKGLSVAELAFAGLPAAGEDALTIVYANNADGEIEPCG